MKAIALLSIGLVAYAGSYACVRATHTKHAFDKVNEVREPYTFFDAHSQWGSSLYILYYPALKLDALISRRPFTRDKW